MSGDRPPPTREDSLKLDRSFADLPTVAAIADILVT